MRNTQKLRFGGLSAVALSLVTLSLLLPWDLGAQQKAEVTGRAAGPSCFLTAAVTDAAGNRRPVAEQFPVNTVITGYNCGPGGGSVMNTNKADCESMDGQWICSSVNGNHKCECWIVFL